MHRKIVKLLAGITLVMVLAATTFAGASTSCTETIETLEYKVERNDETIPQSSNQPMYSGTLTVYENMDDLIEDLPDGAGCAYIHVNGYKGYVLAVAPSEEAQKIDGKKVSTKAFIYTQNDGEDKVTCAGCLDTGSYPLKVKDGVIYAPYEDSDGFHYETYLLTSDGTSLFSKDCIIPRPSGRYSGYIRDTNNEDCTIHYQCTDSYDFDSFVSKYDNARFIEFTVKQ